MSTEKDKFSIDWLAPGTLVKVRSITEIFLVTFWEGENGKKVIYDTRDDRPILYLGNEVCIDDEFYVIRNIKDEKKLSRRHLLVRVFFVDGEKIVWKNMVKEVMSKNPKDIATGIEAIKNHLNEYFIICSFQAEKLKST